MSEPLKTAKQINDPQTGQLQIGGGLSVDALREIRQNQPRATLAEAQHQALRCRVAELESQNERLVRALEESKDALTQVIAVCENRQNVRRPFPSLFDQEIIKQAHAKAQSLLNEIRGVAPHPISTK